MQNWKRTALSMLALALASLTGAGAGCTGVSSDPDLESASLALRIGDSYLFDYDFGSEIASMPTAALLVDVTNEGTEVSGPIMVLVPNELDDEGADVGFYVDSEDCGPAGYRVRLAPGSSCQLRVRMVANAIGPIATALLVTDGIHATSLRLSGTGTEIPAELTFPVRVHVVGEGGAIDYPNIVSRGRATCTDEVCDVLVPRDPLEGDRSLFAEITDPGVAFAGWTGSDGLLAWQCGDDPRICTLEPDGDALELWATWEPAEPTPDD